MSWTFQMGSDCTKDPFLKFDISILHVYIIYIFNIYI